MQKQLLSVAFAALVALAVVLTALASPSSPPSPLPDASLEAESVCDTSPPPSSSPSSQAPPNAEESGPCLSGEQETPPDTQKPTSGVSLPTLSSERRLINTALNGRTLPLGYCALIDGLDYFSVEAFALFTGAKSLSATVGECYICSLDRTIPCSTDSTDVLVLELDGIVCAPLGALAHAASLSILRSDSGISIWGLADYRTAAETYSEDDLYWLSRIIAAEARGEPFLGQLAVGNVVLNRMSLSYFPDNVYGVVFDRRGGVQFTPAYCDGFDVPPPESCIVAAKLCLEGFSLSDDILYFFNSSICSGSWIVNNCVYIMSVGAHDFYADA